MTTMVPVILYYLTETATATPAPLGTGRGETSVSDKVIIYTFIY